MADDDKCYVFNPSKTRPMKRKRVERDATWEIREGVYRDLWNQQRNCIQMVLDDANHATIDEILDFLDGALRVEDVPANGPIPTGFILAGPDTTSHSAFFDQLADRLGEQSATGTFVSLSSSECGNSLKGLLKSLVRNVIGDESDLTVDNGTTKLLDYDLRVLAARIDDSGKNGLVLALQDSEAFSTQVVMELIDLFSAWESRIPLVLLLGIATSIEIFQDRMPRSALKRIRGRQFEVVNSDELLERIFSATILGGSIPFRIGSDLAHTIIGRQKQYIQSPNDFIDAIQYAYMSHFYSNPLSIFLKDDLEFGEVTPDQFKALRHTTSFQRLINGYVEDQRSVKTARILLQSDQELFDEVLPAVIASQLALDRMTTTIQLLHAIRSRFPALPPQPISALYVQALGGDIQDSPTLRETLLTLKRSSSNQLQELLWAIRAFLLEEEASQLKEFEEELEILIKEATAPLKSQYDVQNQTMRTTVVAQKVELSKHRAKVTEQDASYSELLDSIHDWIKAYLARYLQSAEDVLFSEVFIYDGKGPDRAAFMSRHRQAIERALSSPHDYLNCDCCQIDPKQHADENTLLSTQPPTALLYQLYLESGSSINVSDLWTAFKGIVASEKEEEEENQTMFLFQRSLAELSYLGMVKSTRRKADHIIKTSWKGI